MSRQHTRISIPAVLAAAAVILGLTAVQAQEALVQDSDFVQLPGAWIVPPDAPWTGTNADGHSDNHSLRYSAPGRSRTEPVTQTISLPADTALVLSCALKGDGTLTPVVRLRLAGEEGAELVRIVGEGQPGLWRQYFADFNSGAGGEAVVELWPDIMHLQSPERAGPAGTAGFDDVHVVLPQDAAALRTEHSEAVAYENIARGKPYTLHPMPNYPLCTDPDDRIQLTDGQYTVGYFWTQKTTVGWVRLDQIVITIDLENHYPIRGLSFNKAAGIAGVNWPQAIEVMVSVDGRAYHPVGDLVELSGRHNPPPPYGDYAIHRFFTDELQVHGRYVKLLITPQGNTTFVDEIEVYRGENQWLQASLPGEAVNFPPEYFDPDPFMATVKRRMGKDLEHIRTELESEQLADDVRARLAAEMAELDVAIREIPDMDEAGFRAVFPFDPVHERIYAVRGAARAAQGLPPLVAWSGNPWEYLTPTTLPSPPSPAALTVAAMPGETRAVVLNLTNCTASAMTGHLTFDGLPGGALPGWVEVREVAWTDTQEGTAVAAALPEAAMHDEGWAISLPAGITRQVWLAFSPRDIPAGTHQGSIRISDAAGEALQIPLNVRVFGVTFPDRPRLHVGGWDYTNGGGMYDVRPGNRDALIAHLQSRHVDSPWATYGVLAFGEFGDGAQFAVEPNTTSFDNWVNDWPDARRYMVFCRVGDNFGGAPIGEPLFAQRVATWIRFWADHARSRNIPPEQLYVLLVDEPQTTEQDEIIIAWSQAIRAVEPGVNIWDDGTRPPERNTPEILAAVDYLCPHRPSLMAEEDPENVEFYREQAAAGMGLDLYSCWGPTRTLDPYAYYRLQAWHAFDLGGGGSFFWAFGSSGGNSWNEYASRSTSYTPIFIEPDGITAGKHMEAIRESVYDFEYLSLLRDTIADLAQRRPDHPQLPEARELLATATQRVLSAPGAGIEVYERVQMHWTLPRDRETADQVRIEIGEMLERLQGAL